MKKIIIVSFGMLSLNLMAQPIPVSSLGNTSYTLNENGTPIPNDNAIKNGAKVPFIAENSTFTPQEPSQPLPGLQSSPPSVVAEEPLKSNQPMKIPSDISELIKGNKNGGTINETNNSSKSLSSNGVTGVTLQTEPINFSSTRGYIEDWNKTTIEEHTKKGGETSQKRYEEFLNKK